MNHIYKDEDEARELAKTLPKKENGLVCLVLVIQQVKKILKEFFTDKEILDMSRFENLGVIKMKQFMMKKLLNEFEATIKK